MISPSITQSLVLLAYMAVGFFCFKGKILSEDQTKGISRLLVTVTLPLLIFTSMQRPYQPELLREILVLFGVSVLAYGISIALAFLLVPLMKAPPRQAGVYRFAMIFSNVGFMGYPIMEALFGKGSLFNTAIYNTIFQVLAFSLGISLLSADGGRGKIEVKRVFLNPNILAAGLGLLFFLAQIPLPKTALSAMSRLGDVTTPLSMVFIGTTVARFSPGKLLRDWRVWAVSAYRVVAIPIILFLALRPLCATWGFTLNVPIVIAAMPVAANAAILADQYGADAEMASILVIISTLMSMITIPLGATLLFHV
jgi:predicted permease